MYTLNGDDILRAFTTVLPGSRLVPMRWFRDQDPRVFSQRVRSLTAAAVRNYGRNGGRHET
jgi:hypothetical protein